MIFSHVVQGSQEASGYRGERSKPYSTVFFEHVRSGFMSFLCFTTPDNRDTFCQFNQPLTEMVLLIATLTPLTSPLNTPGEMVLEMSQRRVLLACIKGKVRKV